MAYLKLGWNLCAEAPPNVLTSAKFLLAGPKKDAQVIQVRVAVAPRVFELELLVVYLTQGRSVFRQRMGDY